MGTIIFLSVVWAVSLTLRNLESNDCLLDLGRSGVTN